MSPGSRNAPLTISFARNSNIKKYIIPDERTAGFIALGIAQKTKEPVVLCCTSGTALLNYAPAVAEAYYREIPLIVLSADRPAHLIDQRDGQTIRQFEALKNHVKTSLQLPLVKSELNAKEYHDQLIQGLRFAQELAKGPVHFNIPFEEPFYPKENDVLVFENYNLSQERQPKNENLVRFPLQGKVLILVGQMDTNEALSTHLNNLQHIIPIIQSPLNNLQIEGIEHIDTFIENQSALTPDILLTAGLSVLSKKLKQFIRKNKPKQHFHFDPAGIEVDTFSSSPQLIQSSLLESLTQLDYSDVDHTYLEKWRSLAQQGKSAVNDHFQESEVFSEAITFKLISESLPKGSHLHLGNSMPVRYADLFGIPKEITTWSNRGTSGIDGCTSTAVGSSLICKKLHTLFTGDVSFFYDSNAFFHNYRLPNLRIVVFNNQGGGIFRLIDGPANLPELEDYFETRHQRTAKYICMENDISYIPVATLGEITKALETFYEPSEHCKILEVFTNPETNQKEYKKLKQYIHEQVSN